MDPFPGVTETWYGANGLPAGTNAEVTAEAKEIPRLVVAITLKTYETPLVRPVISHVSALTLQVAMTV
jgi:hypothetical protein